MAGKKGAVRRLVNLLGAGVMMATGLAASSARAAPLLITAFGDSLTAGYGLEEPDSFPAQLEARLQAQGYAVEVGNAGVSGDTTAGGRARLDWALADRPAVVVLCLGANDALRGLDPALARANLDAILARLGEDKIKVLLAGMRAPPNLGPDYARRFDAIYPELARKYGAAFYPFFLDGVAARPELNQADGIHPNRDGVAVIVDRLLPSLLPLLPPP
ncbi:MAG: arylesterase [Azospirillum sp.]|nr:arylesterase [Azospirillum sp.]